MENFHYRPTWDAERELYDQNYTALRLTDPYAYTDPRQYYYTPFVANAAERYAFTSDTAMREPDGRAVITLARDARPGNWLPIGGSSRINLILTVQNVNWAAAVSDGSAKSLPAIERVACR